MERTICIDCGQLNAAGELECRTCGSSRLGAVEEPLRTPEPALYAASEPTVSWDSPPAWKTPPPTWGQDDESTTSWSGPPPANGWVCGSAAAVAILLAGMSGFWVGRGASQPTRAAAPAASVPAMTPAPLPLPPQAMSPEPAWAPAQPAQYAAAGQLNLATWQPIPTPTSAPVQAAFATMGSGPAGFSRAVPPLGGPQRVASAEIPLPPPVAVYGATPRAPAQVVAVSDEHITWRP